MPSRAWPIWLYTFLLIVGYPIADTIYNVLVSHSGIPPADPPQNIYDSISMALLLCPAVIAATWFCTRQYNPGTRLLAWSDDERLLRSILATLLFGTIFLILLVLLSVELSDWRWSNSVWVIYVILWLPWPACLRAALIDQQGEILHEPKVTSAFALVLAIISYAAASSSALVVGLGILTLLGKPDEPDSPDYAWIYLVLLAVFAACTYYSLRNVDQPKRGRVIMLFLGLLVVCLIIVALLA